MATIYIKVKPTILQQRGPNNSLVYCPVWVVSEHLVTLSGVKRHADKYAAYLSAYGQAEKFAAKPPPNTVVEVAPKKEPTDNLSEYFTLSEAHQPKNTAVITRRPRSVR